MLSAAPATELAVADRAAPPTSVASEGPLASPDVGAHCADRLDAAGLNEFFSERVGEFQGADYQRAIRLPDDRVLWTFQDAFVSGRLVHNVGMIQSGRCFTLLGGGTGSWLLADETRGQDRWHWVLGGGVGPDGERVHLYVVEMTETGADYLDRPRPTALRRVVVDLERLEPVDVVLDERIGEDLYGWSVTSDGNHTYLYSHCYRQFGFDTVLGFGACSVDVKLARVPHGRFGADREYWDGSGWTADASLAEPVVDAAFVGSGNNPAQIRFDGEHFLLVEKRDDWWGETVEFGISARPSGPFTRVHSIAEPLRCDRSLCNSYFASWVPWRQDDGAAIWAVGHNRWAGTTTADHLDDYRPTFSAIDL